MFMKKLFNWKANRKKGFSLVELIVVIAIMAVLIAVLAPSLLSYTERSRAQKDDSAMSEVANAMLLGLSNADAYDEAVRYSNPSNVSCYVDSDTEAGREVVITKPATGQIKTQYTFGDDERLADETQYFTGGNMRGLTITFEPTQGEGNQTQYVLEDGVINKFVGTKGRLGDTDFLYNLVRQTVGNDIILASQTYRNSEYTIFIKLGTTGGEQSSAQDAIEVYGQYSGTNLPVTDPASYGMTVDRNTVLEDSEFDEDDFFEEEEIVSHDGPAIPNGAIYGHRASGNDIIYETMPETVTPGDYYIYGDYKYVYENNNLDGVFGFTVSLNTDKNKTSYGEILSSINGESVIDTSCLFYGCTKMIIAPDIPDSVLYMYRTFENCTALTVATLSNNVIQLEATFRYCTSLVVAPEIPDSVKHMAWAFDGCSSLTTVPRLSNNDPDMTETFYECTALVEAPIIPEGVTELEGTFHGCTSLKTVSYLPQSLKKLSYTFEFCESLESVAPIPNGAKLSGTFNHCSSLSNLTVSCKATTVAWIDCRPTIERYHVDGCGH